MFLNNQFNWLAFYGQILPLHFNKLYKYYLGPENVVHGFIFSDVHRYLLFFS